MKLQLSNSTGSELNRWTDSGAVKNWAKTVNMFTRLLQTVLSFKINLLTNFQIGGQLEDKLSNWRTWRTNCQIGGHPPDWRTVVLYDFNLPGHYKIDMQVKISEKAHI